MNKKNIENIIKEKLQDFEYKSYNSDWDSFEKKLPKKKINFSKYIIAAASVIIIAVAIAYNVNSENSKHIITHNTKTRNVITETKEKNKETNINTTNITTKDNTEKKEIVKQNNIKPTTNNTIKKESNSQQENNIVKAVAVKPNEQVIVDNYKPNAKFIADKTTICIPDIIYFTPVEENKNIVYLWNFGDGNTSNKKELIHKYTKHGEYTVSLIATNTNNNKSDTFKITILANKTPKADFNYYIFDNTYSFKGTNCEKQIWKFGDKSFSNEINPEHIYSRIGKTLVNFTAINKYGCKSEISKTITIEPVFQIPNAFSPNNDGDNDEFGPIFSNPINYNYYLFVYDAYGKLIFKSQTKNKNWNGEIKNSNKIADKGIYLWKLIISDKYENKVIKKGKLTIK